MLYSAYSSLSTNSQVNWRQSSNDFETGVGVGSGMIEEEDAEDQDYTAFFRDLHMLSKVEDDVRESVKGYFRSTNDLILQMATVTSEDSIIFVRVAYKPNQSLLSSDSRIQIQILRRT